MPPIEKYLRINYVKEKIYKNFEDDFIRVPTDRKIKLLLMTLVTLNILECEVYFIADDLRYYDFLGQWKLCAYTLRGVNPYPLIGVEIPAIKELGIIPAYWGTTPYGLLLGNLFYAGFLSMSTAAQIPSTPFSIDKDLQAYRAINSTLEPAEIYFIVINIIVLSATAIIIFKAFKNFSRKLAWTSALLAIFSFSLLIPLINTGNASGTISCLLILICLLQEDYPKLSGILLAFAMVKPQLALIFCVTLLLMRKFKIIFIAAAIDIAAWLIVSLMVNTSPITLLTEFLSTGAGGNESYAGIFTLFTASNHNLAMLLSMLTGIIYVCIGHKLLSDCKITAFKFFPACIASTFWCYSFYSEFYILILPIIVCVYVMIESKEIVIPFGAALFMTFGVFFWMFFLFNRTISELLGVVDWNTLLSLNTVPNYVVHTWITRTFFEVVVILSGIYLCRRLKNILG